MKTACPVLLVEDDPLVGRAFLRQFQSRGVLFEWCTTVQAGKARLMDRTRTPPSAVILDLDLPDGRGEELVPLISELYPACAVLCVSGYLNGPRVAALLEYRVASVPKPVEARVIADLLAKLRTARPRIAEDAEESEPGSTDGDRASHVRMKGEKRTKPGRRGRVLEQLRAGKSNKEIAKAVGCGVKNVEYHIGRLLKETGCVSRLQLVIELQPTGKRSAAD